jgi:hypothetical protein
VKNDVSRRLTQRQNQIVAMFKLGSSDRRTANVLGLTEGAVTAHSHYRTIGVFEPYPIDRAVLCMAAVLRNSLKPGEKPKI